MSGINILRRLLLKDAALGSGQASGIMSIGDSVRDLAEKRLTSYLMSAQKQGVDIDKLGEQELKYMLEMNKQKSPKVIAADSPEGKGITEALFGKKGEVFNLQGEKLDPNLPISGGTQQGKKINREFFERDAEAKQLQKRIDSGVAATIEKMLAMEPLDAMKEANSVIGRKGIYKNLSEQDVKKILQDTEDHIFERNIDIDPEDFAEGGVAGMLGERQNFKMGRRAFLKMLAGTGAGIAGLKTGITGLGGKKVATEVATEAVKSAGSSAPPPYFFRLVEKIKFMGDDTLATQDKAIAKKYKDYIMEEDFAGNIEIVKKGEDLAGNKLEDVYMSYKVDDVALKNKKGFAKVEEYEEFTARPDMEGKMKDVEPGVPDEVVEEAGNIDAMTLKKADGGLITMLGE